MGAVLLLVVISVGRPLLAQGRWDALAFVVVGLVVVPAVVLAARRGRRAIIPEIVLGPDRVLLPLPRFDHALHARYRDIESLFLRHDPRRGFLWIGTAGATLVYPLGAFAKPADARHVCDAIRQHIEERVPEGSARLATFDSQQHIADRAYGRRLRGLKSLLVLLATALVIEEVGGAAERMFALERFGAHAPLLVREMGHWWRLFTANLLHLHIVHLVVDAALLSLLGAFVERLLGARALLLTVFLGGTLGQLALLISNRAELVVGSAPPACAVLGAFAFTLVRNRGKIPLGFSPSLRLWLIVGMLLGATTLMASEHAFPAYLGGFLGGVLVAAVALEGEPALPLAEGRRPLLTLALIVFASLWTVAVGFAVHYAVTPDLSARVRLVEDHLASNRGTARSLNRLAWEMATDPEATTRELNLAHVAASRVVERNEDDPAFADTLATAEFRLGDTDGAIDRERALLGHEPNNFYAGQLARFLERRQGESGIRFVGVEPWPVEVDFDRHPSRGLTVRTGDSVIPVPVTVYVLVHDHEGLAGLLRFYLPEGKDDAPRRLARQGIEDVFSPSVRYSPVLVVAGREAPRAWLLDPRVRGLP